MAYPRDYAHSTEYADKMQSLIDGFDYGLCEECGADLNGHSIAPDCLGNPHAFCLTMPDTV